MMSLKRIAASTPYRRTGWSVTSAVSSGRMTTSWKSCSARIARYSGSARPACRMNHTGTVSCGSPRHAAMNGEDDSVTAARSSDDPRAYARSRSRRAAVASDGPRAVDPGREERLWPSSTGCPPGCAHQSSRLVRSSRRRCGCGRRPASSSASSPPWSRCRSVRRSFRCSPRSRTSRRRGRRSRRSSPPRPPR